MGESTSGGGVRQAARLNRSGARGIAREFAHLGLHLLVLLSSAGTVGWLNAWLCMALALGFQTLNFAVLYRVNPELLNKRGRVIHPDTKSFDKLFVAIYVLLALTSSVVAGLDAVRFGWSQMPPWMLGVGVALYALSYPLGSWAMATNPHFESTVWVRTDGGQRVCSSGPYRFVRHPGYGAAIVGALGYPCILGSWWTFAPIGLLVVVFVVRTALEDQTLMAELPGYREYAARTPHRLIPQVW